MGKHKGKHLVQNVAFVQSINLNSSSVLFSVATVPSGKLSMRHPHNMWDGVSGSSKSSLDTHESGLKLMMASTSVNTVSNSSYVSLAWTIHTVASTMRAVYVVV